MKKSKNAITVVFLIVWALAATLFTGIAYWFLKYNLWFALVIIIALALLMAIATLRSGRA